MPILVAVREKPMVAFALRPFLGCGHRPKVALMACMRKLLTAIYSVARTRRPFVSNPVPRLDNSGIIAC
jgi:hypothetical protein